MTNPLEQFVLDGLAANDGTNFNMVALEGPPAPLRQRWVQGDDADGDVLGEVSHRGNRVWTLTLQVARQATTDLVLAKIGQWVDKLYECEQQADQGGLPAVWTPGDATKAGTLYVLSGEIIGMPITMEDGWCARAPTIQVRLDARPLLYGTEVTSAATVTNSLPYQVLTVGSVTGDVPAEARLVVTDAATQNRRHLEWGRQWRYYDAATSLYIDSDNMVTTGFAGTQTTRTGADDPGASGNTVIRATLTTSPAAVCGLGNLGHVGSFRPKFRVWAAPTATSVPGDFKVRLTWKEGDGSLRSNPWVSPTVVNGFSEVDLGVISIPPKTLGTQRWTGQVEAYSAEAGDTLDIDFGLLFPTDAYGKGRGIYNWSAGASTAYDSFTGLGVGAALNGRTALAGGTWATSGSATDFTGVNSSRGQSVARSTNSEAGPRYALLGTTVWTDAEAKLSFSASSSDWRQVGVILRWTDANNYVAVLLDQLYTAPFQIVRYVAGVRTLIAAGPVADVSWSIPANIWFGLRATAYADGYVVGAWLDASGAIVQQITGRDSVLATGGTLASGKSGFLDYNPSIASTRTYDDITAGTPAPSPAVIYAGRSAEINSQKAQRQDSTGTYYGDMPGYRVARFFLEPAGDENRTNRVLVKARRNDVDLLADDQIADSTTVTIHYTPRWSTVPR